MAMTRLVAGKLQVRGEIEPRTTFRNGPDASEVGSPELCFPVGIRNGLMARSISWWRWQVCNGGPYSQLRAERLGPYELRMICHTNYASPAAVLGCTVVEGINGRNIQTVAEI